MHQRVRNRKKWIVVALALGGAASVVCADDAATRQTRAEEMQRLMTLAMPGADMLMTQRAADVRRVDFATLQDAAEEVPDLDQISEGGGDNTGTDPRDFSDKFMPYYRYTELENDVEMHSFALFGLIAFNPRLAITYELPVAQKLDVSDVDGFPTNVPNDIPGQFQSSGFPSSGIPTALLNTDMDGEGDEVGMGDLILRMFSRPESWEWTYDDGSGNALGKPKSISLMPTIEMTLPTATEDLLGGESFIISPALTFVMDLPGDAPFGLGFVAGMNFFDFDAYKDSGRDSTTRYRGRYFWMQPLRPPGPGLLDGWYVLTELQPIYDFMDSDFDLWIGPELGKIVSDGFIMYGKPGWGIDTEPEDRDFTFEFGIRIFY